MKVRIVDHALARMKERGCTRPEVEYTVKHGKRAPAKFGRTRFAHRFTYNKKWMGTLHAYKTVEAYAIEEEDADGNKEWVVVTVIVKYA